MTDYKSAAAYLSRRVNIRPQVGIICGSGLSGLSAAMSDTQVITYDKIPGFPRTTVAGHAGELVFGRLGGVPTVCMRGRFHFYEAHPMSTVVMPVRAMRCLGVKFLVVTNAAGGINKSFNIGDVMCMTDHIALPCMAGNNPLLGPNDDALGPRFVPTSNAYNKESRDILLQAAKDLGFDFVRPEGCYAMVSGPNYESCSEIKFLSTIGADAVGMSTVPEVITAHHCGIKVIGLSLVTNKVVMPGEDGPPANHEEVLETAAKRAEQIQALVKRTIEHMQSFLSSLPDLPEVDLSVKRRKTKCADEEGEDYEEG